MSFGKFKELKGNAETSPATNETSKMRDFVKTQSGATSSNSVFGKGSKAVGQIYFEGVAEVDGDIDGEVVSEGVLIVGKSATLKAKITGQDVTVMGYVKGDIEVTKRLSLKHPAQVIGNIRTPLLSMDEGVVFQGGCYMEHSTTQGSSKEKC